MDYGERHKSNEHQEQHRSASESIDPLTGSPLQISTSQKLPRSPKSLKFPKCPRSSSSHHKDGTGKVGSPVKNFRQSHSGRDGRPKKGGCGGKGTWGGLLDMDDGHLDRNDPNYSGYEVIDKLLSPFFF